MRGVQNGISKKAQTIPYQTKDAARIPPPIPPALRYKTIQKQDWSKALMICKKPWCKHPTVNVGALCSKQKEHATQRFPCGKCLPCRVYRSRVWTHRIMLETIQHEKNTFATLTYADPPGQLVPADPRNFFKRLRKALFPRRISYYLCGEYGDKTGREHYHAIIFGVAPNEKKRVDNAWSIDGKSIGHTWLGSVTSASAGYVAGYITKGMDNPDDPWLDGRQPHFSRCSTKPAIGLRTIQDMAEKLKRSKFYDGKPFTALQYGNGKTMPLGRYLFNILGMELGWKVSEIEALHSEWTNDYIESAIIPNLNWYQMVKEKGRIPREKLIKRKKIFDKRGL